MAVGLLEFALYFDPHYYVFSYAMTLDILFTNDKFASYSQFLLAF